MRMSVLSLVLGAAVMLSSGPAFAMPGPTIRPDTAQAAAAVAELKHTEYTYLREATSWGPADPGLDYYYAHKAHEVRQVLAQLERGKAVPRCEVVRALNDHQGTRAGAGINRV